MSRVSSLLRWYGGSCSIAYLSSSLAKRESTVKTQFMHSYSVKIGWEKNCPPSIVDVTQFHGEMGEEKSRREGKNFTLYFRTICTFPLNFYFFFPYFFCASTHSLIRSNNTTHIKALLTALAKSLLFFSAQKCVKSLAIICIMLLLFFLNNEKRMRDESRRGFGSDNRTIITLGENAFISSGTAMRVVSTSLTQHTPHTAVFFPLSRIVKSTFLLF